MVVVCDCGVARCVRLLSRAPALVSRPPACSPVPSEATLSPPPRGHHTPTPPEQALAARIWHIFGRAGASNAAQPPTLTTNRIPNPLAPLYMIYMWCATGAAATNHRTRRRRTPTYWTAAWLPPLRFARAVVLRRCCRDFRGCCSRALALADRTCGKEKGVVCGWLMVVCDFVCGCVRFD